MLFKDCLCPVSLPRSYIFLGIFSTHTIFIWTSWRVVSHLWPRLLCHLHPLFFLPFHSYPCVIFSVNLAVSFSNVCCLHQNSDVFMILFLCYAFLSQHSSCLLQNAKQHDCTKQYSSSSSAPFFI